MSRKIIRIRDMIFYEFFGVVEKTNKSKKVADFTPIPSLVQSENEEHDHDVPNFLYEALKLPDEGVLSSCSNSSRENRLLR